MKKLFLSSLLLSSVFTLAQGLELEPKKLEPVEKPRYLSPLGKMELGLGGIDFGYQHPIATHTLVYANVGMGNAYRHTTRIDFGLARAFATLGIRNYMNLESKFNKQGKIVNNSGNFIGMQVRMAGVEIPRDPDTPYHTAVQTELFWGMQTDLSDNISMEFHIGVGQWTALESKSLDDRAMYPAIGLKFSYRLF